MLKEERQNLILETLRQEGRVLASELSQKLNVSEDTIRRDLNDLAEERLVQRVHGGALLRSPAIGDYNVRQRQALSIKVGIALAAVKLVQSGQVVIMDGGTTTLQVAQHLPDDLSATIVTNSPAIAVALAEHHKIEVIVVGGKLYKNSLTMVGAEAVKSLQTFRADLCLLGICSLHPEVGITAHDLEETYVKRTMITSAAEVVALASADKLNTAAPFVVAPISELTHLITEESVSAEILAPYYQAGITIITT